METEERYAMNIPVNDAIRIESTFAQWNTRHMTRRLTRSTGTVRHRDYLGNTPPVGTTSRS